MYSFSHYACLVDARGANGDLPTHQQLTHGECVFGKPPPPSPLSYSGTCVAGAAAFVPIDVAAGAISPYRFGCLALPYYPPPRRLSPVYYCVLGNLFGAALRMSCPAQHSTLAVVLRPAKHVVICYHTTVSPTTTSIPAWCSSSVEYFAMYAVLLFGPVDTAATPITLLLHVAVSDVICIRPDSKRPCRNHLDSPPPPPRLVFCILPGVVY